jgi:hypothetical protein
MMAINFQYVLHVTVGKTDPERNNVNKATQTA